MGKGAEGRCDGVWMGEVVPGRGGRHRGDGLGARRRVCGIEGFFGRLVWGLGMAVGSRWWVVVHLS